MPVISPRRSSVAADHHAVATWLGAVVEDVAIETELDHRPDETDEGAGRIDLVLVEIGGAGDQRPDRDLPVRVRLTYLVAPAHSDAIVAGEWLARILVAARDVPDLELADDAAGAEWWLAMGVRPRPHARLRTLLVLERPQPDPAPAVTEPLHVEVSGRGALTGTVVDEEGRPLAGAVVRLTDLGQRTEADHHGRFSFSSIALGHRAELAVTRGATTYAGTVPADATGHQTIRCTVTESVG